LVESDAIADGEDSATTNPAKGVYLRLKSL